MEILTLRALQWIDIVGVPRELKVEQTIGLTNLGTVAKPKGGYRVCISSEVPGLSDAGPATSEEPKPVEPTARTIAATPARPTPGLAASIHASWAPGPPAQPPRKPESTSIYCRHWCHHGTCRWGYNCRYQHAMPATADGLREVGLADFPAWWTAAMELALSGGLGAGGGAGSMGFVNPVAAAARVAMLGSVHGGAGSVKKQKKLHELRQLMAAGLGLGLGVGGGVRPVVGAGYPIVETPVLLAERTESDRDRERETAPEAVGKDVAAVLLPTPAPAENPHDIGQELEEKLVDI